MPPRQRIKRRWQDTCFFGRQEHAAVQERIIGSCSARDIASVSLVSHTFLNLIRRSVRLQKRLYCDYKRYSEDDAVRQLPLPDIIALEERRHALQVTSARILDWSPLTDRDISYQCVVIALGSYKHPRYLVDGWKMVDKSYANSGWGADKETHDRKNDLVVLVGSECEDNEDFQVSLRIKFRRIKYLDRPPTGAESKEGPKNDLIHPRAAKETIDIFGRIYVELECQPCVQLGPDGLVAISYLVPNTDISRWHDDPSEDVMKERWETMVLNWKTGVIHGILSAEKYSYYGSGCTPVHFIGSHTLAVLPALGPTDVHIELYDLDEVRKHSRTGSGYCREEYFDGDKGVTRLKPTRTVKPPEYRKDAYQHLRPGAKRQQWNIATQPVCLHTGGKIVIAMEDGIMLDPKHYDEENDPQAPEQRTHSVHTYASLDVDSLRRAPEVGRSKGSRLKQGGKVEDAWHLRCYEASHEIIGQNPPMAADRVCIVGDLLLSGLSVTPKGELVVRVLDYGAESRALRERKEAIGMLNPAAYSSNHDRVEDASAAFNTVGPATAPTDYVLKIQLPEWRAECTSPVLVYLAGDDDTLVVGVNGVGIGGVSSETMEDEEGTQSERTGGRAWVLALGDQDLGAEPIKLGASGPAVPRPQARRSLPRRARQK